MNLDRTEQRPMAGLRLIGGLGLVLVAALGLAAWYAWARPTVRAERLLARAVEWYQAGDAGSAERAAVAAWELNPQLAPAARLAAELNHHELHRLARAEHWYRAALDLEPDDPAANEGLAKLLGLCARRSEAIPHVLRLVRLGRAGDLLVLLARESGVINDHRALQRARQAAPGDANPLIGLAWHAAEREQTDEAISLLREAVRLEPAHAAAHVALGHGLLAADRFEELVPWEQQLPPAADEFAEAWFVRGRMAEHEGDVPGGVRCYGEAARRAPESKAIVFRLARLLAESGAAGDAERCAAHVRRLVQLETMQDRVLFSSDDHGIDAFRELVQSFAAAGRLWEAWGWCQLLVEVDPRHESVRRDLESLRRRVDGLPLTLTTDAANPALALDLSAYPLPQFGRASDAPTSRQPPPTGTLSFRDDAEMAGLRFRYFNGTAGPPTRRMFEFTGGGIGVLDFDGDGWPDVFFTQGRPWGDGDAATPGPSVTPPGDRLFRNIAGTRFEDVTDSAGLDHDGFGQGVTVGDFDSDGFPDLFVANIGPNRMWRNNGDGTFSDVTDSAGVAGDADEWTTSCVLADLDGDGLPDLYAVNYVTAPDVFDRVCRHGDGAPRLCMPFDFDGQPDRLWLNAGDGRFVDAAANVLSTVPDGKGLGVAAWDADGTGRLSLFVANDTTPNFFFVNRSAADGRFRLEERGIASGLALNAEGKAEGCMGIALGDVDGDGRLDVHVTNFLAESNTLYAALGEGFYEDRTRAAGLHLPTLDVLGFGTQFLDANLDGRLELFVANGHIDDLRRYGRPYAMRPQLFRWTGRQFAEIDAAEVGPYFQAEWLGRPAARIDWNRDGREDLIVGHLGADSALLTNTTPEAGRFLAVRLIGTRSSRDAIGTTVTVRLGNRTLVRQLTAGDGYQSSNERRLVFGTGSAEQVDELIVRWASGRERRFEGVGTSQEMLLREGDRDLLFAAPAPGR